MPPASATATTFSPNSAVAYSATSWPCWAKSNADATPPLPAPSTATRIPDLLDVNLARTLAEDVTSLGRGSLVIASRSTAARAGHRGHQTAPPRRSQPHRSAGGPGLATDFDQLDPDPPRLRSVAALVLEQLVGPHGPVAQQGPGVA